MRPLVTRSQHHPIRFTTPRAAEEAAKKAASAALTSVLEGDLLSKPLALFTPVVLQYALPWDAFLEHAFAATFGRGGTASTARVGPDSSSHPSNDRASPRLEQSSTNAGAEPATLSLLAPQQLSREDRFVLGAAFLRSPPRLVRLAAAAAAAASSEQHQSLQAKRVLASTSRGDESKAIGDSSAIPRAPSAPSDTARTSALLKRDTLPEKLSSSMRELAEKVYEDAIRSRVHTQRSRTTAPLHAPTTGLGRPRVASVSEAYSLSGPPPPVLAAGSPSRTLSAAVPEVHVVETLTRVAESLNVSRMRTERLLLQALLRAQPAAVEPLCPGAGARKFSVQLAKHGHSGQPSVASFIGWRYLRVPLVNRGASSVPDVIIRAAARAGHALSDLFMEVSRVTAPNPTPALSCRLYASSATLPTASTYVWASPEEATEVLRDHATALAATTRPASRTRCLCIRRGDPRAIRDWGSAQAADGDQKMPPEYYVAVCVSLTVPLPLNPGAVLPRELAADLDCEVQLEWPDDESTSPATLHGSPVALPSEKRGVESVKSIDVYLARFRAQVAALGGTIEAGERSVDGVALPLVIDTPADFGPVGPLRIWQSRGASADPDATDTPIQPWNESLLVEATAIGLPSARNAAVGSARLLSPRIVAAVRRKNGRFVMREGEMPVAVERSSSTGTLHRVRIAEADREAVVSEAAASPARRSPRGLRAKSLSSSRLRVAPSDVPGVPALPPLTSELSRGIVLQLPSSPSSVRRPLERAPSLPNDYYYEHSRPPPLGGEAEGVVVAGMLSLPQPAPPPRVLGSVRLHPDNAPSLGSEHKAARVLRVKWKLSYAFAHDPLLDGSDVPTDPPLQPLKSPMSSPISADASSPRHNATRGVLRAAFLTSAADDASSDEDARSDGGPAESPGSVSAARNGGRDEAAFRKDAPGLADASTGREGSDEALAAAVQMLYAQSAAQLGDGADAALGSPGAAIDAYFTAVAESQRCALDLLVEAAADVQETPTPPTLESDAKQQDSRPVDLLPLRPQGAGELAFPAADRAPLIRSRVRLPVQLSYLAPRLASAAAGDGEEEVPRAAGDSVTLLSPEVAAAVEVEQRIYRQIRRRTAALPQLAGAEMLQLTQPIRALPREPAASAKVCDADSRLARVPPLAIIAPTRRPPMHTAPYDASQLPHALLPGVVFSAPQARRSAEISADAPMSAPLQSPPRKDDPQKRREVAATAVAVPRTADAAPPPIALSPLVAAAIAAETESPLEASAAPRFLDSPTLSLGAWDDDPLPNGAGSASREQGRERTTSAAAAVSQGAPRQALLASVARYGVREREPPFGVTFTASEFANEADLGVAATFSAFRAEDLHEKPSLPRRSPLVRAADQADVDHQRQVTRRLHEPLSRAVRETDQRRGAVAVAPLSVMRASSLFSPGGTTSKPPPPPLVSSSSEPLLRHAIAAMCGEISATLDGSPASLPSLAPDFGGLAAAQDASVPAPSAAKKRKSKAPKHARRLLDAIVGRF